MNSKIILITGATSGIGLAAARELAKTGATLVIHGRNEQKLNTVKTELAAICGEDKINVLLADMSSMEDVRKMADQFHSMHNKLDVLINNAGGVMTGKRQETKDGMEMTFALNVASVYLLTGLLFDKLRKSESARIINISSLAHKFGTIDFTNLQSEKKYSSGQAYGNAKLQVVLLTEELHERMQKAGIDNISVNALHPGVVSTNFALDSTGSPFKFYFKYFGFLFISPEKGARTTLHLATSEKAEGISGKYFKKCKIAPTKRTYITKENKQKLWKTCEKLTSFQYPDIS